PRRDAPKTMLPQRSGPVNPSSLIGNPESLRGEFRCPRIPDPGIPLRLRRLPMSPCRATVRPGGQAIMKRLITMLGCAVLVAAVPAMAQTKTVKGSVKEVGANTITVTSAGKDMTFNVDAKTTVVARGAGTKSKAAEAAGKTGPGIAEVLKAGEAVEVSYHEAGMDADTRRAIGSVAATPQSHAPE